MPATYATCTQPHIALWLERPIHWPTGDLARPETSASLSLSWEQATVRFWPATCTYRTTTLSSVPTLRRRRRDGAASSTLLPATRAGTFIYQLHQFNRSSTHVVLHGVNRGRYTSPWPGMRGLDLDLHLDNLVITGACMSSRDERVVL